MTIIDDSFLADFDPDDNYYNQLCDQNQAFSVFNSFQDFYDFYSNSMSDNNLQTIFCQNMNVNRYLDSLMTLFNNQQVPDVMVLTETWLNDVSTVIVPGYIAYSSVRSGRSGGVTILVKNSLKSCLIEEYSFVNNTIDLCTIRISNNSSHIILSGIYRPHSDSIENFTYALNNLLNFNTFRNNS